ncbi:hypothetical protein CRYUN_Cryun17cG0001700 [Craigia yunnanensis]
MEGSSEEKAEFEEEEIEYASYGDEHHLPLIMSLVDQELTTELVTRSIGMMMESGCEEVTLEAEVTSKGALALYGRLGFIRAKRLFHYYLNGVDAFCLKLLFPGQELHFSAPMMTNRDASHEQSDPDST